MAPTESPRRFLSFYNVEEGHLVWTNGFKHKGMLSHTKWIRQSFELATSNPDHFCLHALAQALTRTQYDLVMQHLRLIVINIIIHWTGVSGSSEGAHRNLDINQINRFIKPGDEFKSDHPKIWFLFARGVVSAHGVWTPGGGCPHKGFLTSRGVAAYKGF